MAIELPDLVQRIRVDASDLARAEKQVKASGRSYDKTSGSAEHLARSSDDAADSTGHLGEEMRTTSRESDGAARSSRRLADVIGRVRDVAVSTRKAVSAQAVTADDLRSAELRLSVAHKEVEVAQGRLNKLRDEGRKGDLTYARAELAVINSLRRVSREQQVVSRTTAAFARDNDHAGLALARFSKRAREAGDAGRFLQHIISTIKIPAIVTVIGLAGSAIAALGAGAIALVGQLGPATGAIAALPAGLLALKSATGVFKSLTTGPAEAAKAIRQYGASSDQARKALAALSPQARIFAADLVVTQNRLDGIKKAGQAAALPGFTTALERARKLLPVVRAGFVGVATSLSAVAKSASVAFTSVAFRRDLGVISARNSTLVRVLGRAAVELVGALKGVVLAAGPMVDVFSRAILSLSRVANASANTASGQAKLGAFFGRTTNIVLILGRTLRDLSAALVNTFRIGARAIGIDFFGSLEQASARFRAFTESFNGQSRIARYFAGARPALVETGRLIRDITKAFGGLAGAKDLAPVIAQIRTQLLPAIVDLVTSVTGRLGPTLVNIATAFVKFLGVLSFSPIITVAGALAKLVGAVADLASTMPALGTVIASLLAFKIALSGIAVAGKFTGVTGLAGALSSAGKAGASGQTRLAGFVQGLKGIDAAALGSVTRVNRLGSAFRGINISASGSVANVGKLRGAVGGFASALGGPWTLAVVGGITLLGAWAAKHREAKARVEALTQALIADNGVIATNTREVAFNNLQKSGAVDAAKKLGVSLADLTDAALGDEAAQARVNAVLNNQDDSVRRLVGAISTRVRIGAGASKADKDTASAIDSVNSALGQQEGDLDKSRRALADRAAAGLGAAAADDALAASIDGVSAASGGLSVASAASRRSLIAVAIQAGLTRAAAKKLANQYLGIPPVRRTRIIIDGAAEAIRQLAAVRFAATNIPVSVTVGVLNKIKGAGGALGAPPNAISPAPVSPRVAERAAATAAAKGAGTPKVKDVAAGAGANIGAAAAKAAAPAFVNEFVKHGRDLTKAGTRLVANLVKALTGSQDKIRAAATNLRTLIHGAFSGSQEDRLIARVAKTNKRLLALARQRDALTQRITDARQQVIDAARSAGEGLTASITGSANVTETGNDAGVTNVLRIIGNLREKVAAARRFVADLRALRKRGINAETLRQLVEAGPEAGGPAARALASATDAQIKEINTLQNTLTKSGASAGKFAQNALEQLGLQAISGLLAGLRKRRKDVEREMLHIARAMSDAIKKALGIHSPSRVMYGLAHFAVTGVVNALHDGTPSVSRAASEIGRAIIPNVPLSSAAGALRQGTAPAGTTVGQHIDKYFNIHRLEQTAINPEPETATVSTREGLRKLGATLAAT